MVVEIKHAGMQLMPKWQLT